MNNVIRKFLWKKINDLSLWSRDPEKSKQKAAVYFNHDHTHTSYQGALMNARSVARGLKASASPLAAYLRK